MTLSRFVIQVYAVYGKSGNSSRKKLQVPRYAFGSGRDDNSFQVHVKAAFHRQTLSHPLFVCLGCGTFAGAALLGQLCEAAESRTSEDSLPRRLKPHSFCIARGTAEAVPLRNFADS